VKTDQLEIIAKASRKAAGLSALGAAVVIGSLLYGAVSLRNLEGKIDQSEKELKEKQQQVERLRVEVEALRATQSDLLDFLARVASANQISILDPSIDWERLRASILSLPPGKRKQAILTAILIAWKEVPFTLGGHAVATGFDSPRFLHYVLGQVGVTVKQRPGERLSDALMREFEKTNSPVPGDLVFYKGQVGSFGFLYLSADAGGGGPAGIGTLQAIAPLQILSLSNVNTPSFPLIGYFHVGYPDETQN